MKIKPDSKDRRLALRILSEGIQGQPGVWKHKDDLGIIGWAHAILSMALKDLEKYEGIRSKSEEMVSLVTGSAFLEGVTTTDETRRELELQAFKQLKK